MGNACTRELLLAPLATHAPPVPAAVTAAAAVSQRHNGSSCSPERRPAAGRTGRHLRHQAPTQRPKRAVRGPRPAVARRALRRGPQQHVRACCVLLCAGGALRASRGLQALPAATWALSRSVAHAESSGPRPRAPRTLCTPPRLQTARGPHTGHCAGWVNVQRRRRTPAWPITPTSRRPRSCGHTMRRACGTFRRAWTGQVVHWCRA